MLILEQNSIRHMTFYSNAGNLKNKNKKGAMHSKEFYYAKTTHLDMFFGCIIYEVLPFKGKPKLIKD